MLIHRETDAITTKDSQMENKDTSVRDTAARDFILFGLALAIWREIKDPSYEPPEQADFHEMFLSAVRKRLDEGGGRESFDWPIKIVREAAHRAFGQTSGNLALVEPQLSILKELSQRG